MGRIVDWERIRPRPLYEPIGVGEAVAIAVGAARNMGDVLSMIQQVSRDNECQLLY